MTPGYYKPAADSVPVLLDTLLTGFTDDLQSVSESATQVSGLSLDSRKVRRGDAYIALQGETAHGLDYLDSALKQGASAVLVDRDDPVFLKKKITSPVPVVTVPHLRESVGELAARYFDNPSRKLGICGVTGTDGKTSVCRFISESLRHLGFCTGYIGTIGWGLDGNLTPNPLTTPDPITLQGMIKSLLEQGAQFVALEVSSHALVQGRVNGVAFDVAVLTNLGRDHLDYHGDLASYRAAKRMLFEWPELSAVVLNADDAFGRSIADEIVGDSSSSTPVVNYSTSVECADTITDVRAQKVVTTTQGLAFDLIDGDVAQSINSRLLGRFNVDNLLACYCVLKSFGIATHDAGSVLGRVTSVPGRMERFSGSDTTKIWPTAVIDFAHTPQALDAALQTLRPHCAGQLWVVFGCGGDRDPGKRAPMGDIACRGADRIVVTDDNPRTESSANIIKQILAGTHESCDVRAISDRLSAIEYALLHAAAGDWVLIAGKGHEDYQIVGEEYLPFSDRDVVTRVLGQDNFGQNNSAEAPEC